MKYILAVVALLVLAVSCQASVPSYQAEFSAPAQALLAGIPTPVMDVEMVAERGLDVTVDPAGISVFCGIGGGDTNLIGVSYGFPLDVTLGDVPVLGPKVAEVGLGLEKLAFRIDGLVGQTLNDAGDETAVAGVGLSLCSEGEHLTWGVGGGFFPNKKPVVYLTLKVGIGSD